VVPVAELVFTPVAELVFTPVAELVPMQVIVPVAEMTH